MSDEQIVVRGRAFGRTVQEEVRELPAPNADGSYTLAEPGLYGIDGVAVVRARVPGVLEPEQARAVGVQAAPVAYTPPKYGPPPGVSAEKWRTMNRAQRRDQLKAIAKSVNAVARQPEGE